MKKVVLAAFLFRDHPDVERLPTDAAVRDTLIFRFAMSAQLLVMRWLSFGGVTSVPLDKMRNDVVDMTYVAYATFFDGLLSNHKKMLEIHEEAEFFLEHVFRMS